MVQTHDVPVLDKPEPGRVRCRVGHRSISYGSTRQRVGYRLVATAATAAATTVAAAAATTTIATATAITRGPFAGLVHAHRTAAVIGAVEGGDRGGSAVSVHFHETEAAGAAGVTVGGEGNGDNFTEGFELGPNLVFSGAKGEITDKQLG